MRNKDANRRTSLTNCFSAPSAHIGIPLSGVVAARHLSFFRASLDLKFLPEICRDPATRSRSRAAGQCTIAIAREEACRAPKLESVPPSEAKPEERRAPARADRPLQGHRADPALHDLPRRLRCHREISVGDIAVDRDRLDPLPRVRDDHGARDGAGLAALCDADAARRLAADARRRAARLLAVLHLRASLSADRRSVRHRLRCAAVRHRAVDRLAVGEGRRASLDGDRGGPARRAGHPAPGLGRIPCRRLLSDRLGAGLGRDA